MPFRHPVPQDAERCYEIEIGAYEGDEAAELYRRMGYAYVRTSPSDHGGMAWHEMLMPL